MFGFGFGFGLEWYCEGKDQELRANWSFVIMFLIFVVVIGIGDPWGPFGFTCGSLELSRDPQGSLGWALARQEVSRDPRGSAITLTWYLMSSWIVVIATGCYYCYLLLLLWYISFGTLVLLSLLWSRDGYGNDLFCGVVVEGMNWGPIVRRSIRWRR